MHELHLTTADKAARYAQILPQLRAIIEDESDTVANLANTAAVLKEAFGWLWVGFYLVRGRELVLSPFQGPLACTRIPYGRGVCGQAWQKNEVMLVPDVDAHPDHIACSSRSKSEIVVPLADEAGRVWGVLDADAETLAAFDETDADGLTKVAALLSRGAGAREAV
mgnify:CR=1 FL=1